MSTTIKQQDKKDRGPMFGSKAQYELGRTLEKVIEKAHIEWEFTEDIFYLTFRKEDICRDFTLEFTHWRSAAAYLDAYLHGWRDCEEQFRYDCESADMEDLDDK